MYKTLLTLAVALNLGACSSQQEQDLRSALITKFKGDSDMTDYHLDPEKMADCVTGEITRDLPGFPGDPRRQTYLEAFTRFANAKTASEAHEAVVQSKDAFDSEQQAREAALSITEHVMSCMGRFLGSVEDSEAEGDAAMEAPTDESQPPAAEPETPPSPPANESAPPK